MKYKMMLVGEAFNEREAEEGKPFVGPNGSVLNMMFNVAGIAKQEVYLTNVFNLRPSPNSNDLSHLCGPKESAIKGYPALTSGKYVRAEFQSELDRLFKEIEREAPNVIIAAGATPAWALLGVSGIRKVRGAPSYTAGQAAAYLGRRKVLPTYHPSAVNREWKLRPVVMADFEKALRESAYPEIRRPAREFWIEPSIADLYEFRNRYIQPSCDLSIDIETAAGQITCIGFAPSAQVGLVVPIIDPMAKDGNYWRSINEEMAAWEFIRDLCEHHPGIFQNGLYDINYLWRTYGIRCFGAKDDTMLLHHALQPEMEKGLGFLGSVYTDEQAWKFMRAKHETLKKED